jgi:hypothetical protein
LAYADFAKVLTQKWVFEAYLAGLCWRIVVVGRGKERGMNNKVFLAMSAAAGAALMYLLDPDRGKRRRALIRDKVVRLKHNTADGISATMKDVRNRTLGIAARTRRVFHGRKVSDETVAQKVRLAVRDTASHPGAIETHVEHGRVVLTGDVLESEVPHLLAEVRRIAEASSIDNQLRTHASTDHISALQGEPAKRTSAM